MPRQKTAPSDYPQAVLKQIEQLAQNIVIARKRRGESQAQWAKKLGISQPTMVRIERGDPSVAMASYVMCMWLINPAAALADLITPATDHGALEKEVARVRVRRKPFATAKKAGDPAPPAYAKAPTASYPTHTSTALATPAAGREALGQAQNSLEETMRASLAMNTPNPPTSQAQGIAALLAKTGPREND